MLTAQLVNPNIPQLQPEDAVAKAKQLINDFKLTHLPVVDNKKFLGLISEEDLMDITEDKATIGMIVDQLFMAFLPEDVHFLNALHYCNQYETNIVPVINRDATFNGSITTTNLLKAIGDFSGANEIGGIIILEIQPVHFSISEISRIVESNNATVLHLNTMTDAITGFMLVSLHLNKREIDAVVSTFERFEYRVVHQFGADKIENKTNSHYRNLMNYLDL
jgi:predicted transcriptional regulator